MECPKCGSEIKFDNQYVAYHPHGQFEAVISVFSCYGESEEHIYTQDKFLGNIHKHLIYDKKIFNGLLKQYKEELYQQRKDKVLSRFDKMNNDLYWVYRWNEDYIDYVVGTDEFKFRGYPISLITVESLLKDIEGTIK